MKVFNRQPRSISSGSKERRIPLFAASLRKATKSIDESSEQQRMLLTTKQKSEWLKIQSDGKKEIAISTNAGSVKKKDENRGNSNRGALELSPGKYPHAIFDLVKTPLNDTPQTSLEGKRYPLSIGVDTKVPGGFAVNRSKKDDQICGLVEPDNEDEEKEKIESLISNLEIELQKLENNLNVKISNEEEEDSSREYADLFLRSPPDDRILKQYFPSMYKTTEEIFTKSATRVPVPTTSSNEVLDDVQRRMVVLTDNLDWAKNNRRSNELNAILDSFKVDPNIVTLKLEIKQLVDDCILSLESEVQDAVQKRLEDDKKKNVFQSSSKLKENVIKSNQISRFCRKNIVKKEGLTAKENKGTKPIASKNISKNFKSSTAGKLPRQTLINQRKSLKANVEEENASFEKIPSLWDKTLHGNLYGNLLKLDKRVSELNPYPHLRNPLPSKPTPWPPKSIVKKNPIRKIQPSVSSGSNVKRPLVTKNAIQRNKINRENEDILQAKLMKVQYKRNDIKPFVEVKNVRKVASENVSVIDKVQKSSSNYKVTFVKSESTKKVKAKSNIFVQDSGKDKKSTPNTEINVFPERKELNGKLFKKQVRFEVTPRPILIPKWSDASPEKELPEDLDDLKIVGEKVKNASVINEVEEHLIENISNNLVIDSKKNPFLTKIALNHVTESTNLSNSKYEIYENDFGGAGDQPRDEIDEPQNEHKQMIHTGGGDAEFVFNKANDLQKKTALNNPAGSLNSDDPKSVSDHNKVFKELQITHVGLDDDELQQNEESNANEKSNMSQMSSSSSAVNEEESIKSLEEIEEDLSVNTKTSSMVHSEASKITKSESESDEITESEKAEVGEMIILPGYTPPLTTNQQPETQTFKNFKKAKRKIPSSLGATNFSSRWQSSNELLLRTAQDWVEKELVARTLSLRLSQNDKQNVERTLSDGNLTEDRHVTLDKELMQSLVEEILKEKTVELLELTRREKENRDNSDVHLQTSDNSENNNEEIILETPQPTPSMSPSLSYSEGFEKSEDDAHEIILTPSLSPAVDSSKERLSGGGRNYKDIDSTQTPFAAYTNEVSTPSPSSQSFDQNSSGQCDSEATSEHASELRAPTQTPTLEPFALRRVPEEPHIFVDETTQTDPVEMMETETDLPAFQPAVPSLPSVPPLPAPSSIYPPEKSSIMEEKATSTPPSPDLTTSTTSPMISSLSEGECINLKPWQRITPFFRYASQVSTWNINNVVHSDNSLQDLDDLEQDPISEGEICIPHFSAWRKSLVAAAIASGVEPEVASQFSASDISILEPGPSTQPSTIFHRAVSPGELAAQVSDVFVLSSASGTAVELQSESEEKYDLERRFSTCSVQTTVDLQDEENPPNLVPVQHITVDDTISGLNEEELLLNALQNVFLPAEPGLVLPVTQSIDPMFRRQYLERLVSEGEIRASFPLSPNRVSNPEHLRSWGRSLVNAMIKKTISAPGLNAHRKIDDGKSIPIQRLSTIIASRNTSRSSQTQTDFPLVEEIKASTTVDDSVLNKTVEMNFLENDQIPTTSNAPVVSFKEFLFDSEEVNIGTIPKIKARKSSLKVMSHSKVQQDINKVCSSASQIGATSSTSIPTMVPTSDMFAKRQQHISVRPSPGMLPEDFQGHLLGLHPVISKSSVIDIGRDMFKDSSGTIMMGSLGTIDEESNEALPGVHKRLVKGVPSSDSESECAENHYSGRRVEKAKKVIDRSLSHSTDLSEGEVPPRETRSHQ